MSTTTELLVLDKPDQIHAYRLLALRGMLSLEAKGMKRRGMSALQSIKLQFPQQVTARTAAKALVQYEAVLRELGVLSTPEQK